MINVANKMVELREETVRVSANELAQQVVLTSAVLEASASVSKAQADLLQARLLNLLARAELEQTVGHTPGL